jgi:hypothetical protein
MKVEHVSHQSDTNALNVGGLIWKVLLQKFKALFHSGSK